MLFRSVPVCALFLPSVPVCAPSLPPCLYASSLHSVYVCTLTECWVCYQINAMKVFGKHFSKQMEQKSERKLYNVQRMKIQWKMRSEESIMDMGHQTTRNFRSPPQVIAHYQTQFSFILLVMPPHLLLCHPQDHPECEDGKDGDRQIGRAHV